MSPSKWTFIPKHNDPMTKTIIAINQIAYTAKHPFPNAGRRPGKARQHRYERRKIKECIHLRDWQDEFEPDARR